MSGWLAPTLGVQFLLTDVAYLTLVGADLSGVLDKTGVSPEFATPSLDTTYVLTPADGVGSEVPGLTSKGCGYVKSTTVVGRAPHMEPVGELHAYYDATATFWYGSTANTDIGIGYKYGSGPWQVSQGASHMGQSGSQVYIKVGPYKGRTVRTQFAFRKERVDLLDYDNKVCQTYYRVVPEGWQGGGIDLDRDVSSGDSAGKFDAARAKGNYLKFGPRSGWRKYQGESHKYTWDVTAYGVTLHANSGWGSNVDITWDFGSGPYEHDLYNIDARPIDAKIMYSY